MDLSEFFVIFWVWAKWKKPNSWPKKKTNFSIDADRLFEVLIEKEESIPRTLTLIQKIQAEVKKEKKLNNKESFAKFLEKEWLSLHIKTQNVENIVQQRENIFNIDAVNLPFVKENCFTFCVRKPFIVPKSKRAEICEFSFSIWSKSSTSLFQTNVKKG